MIDRHQAGAAGGRVKRFCPSGSDDGDYVLYSDYAALQASHDTCREANMALAMLNKKLRAEVDRLKKKCNRLVGELVKEGWEPND